MLAHWIWLAHRPALSDRTKLRLLEHFSDPEGLFYADSETLAHLEFLSPEARESLAEKNLGEARKIISECAGKKLGILTYRDAAYPAKLKNISDPPIVLYYKGQLPELDASPVIGVVGTRRASAYGLTAAKRMGYQIGKCGGVIVSGMAAGIDAMALSGALTAGASVVGVLGCGADVVYPASNRGLFRDVENYGCILSEFPPGTAPAGWHFPKRNRIISALSNGVLVVEAPEKSGALITASLAAEQGRDVFVVPGNIDQPGFVGSNRLLREGGIAVSCGWDVLEEYAAVYPDKVRRERDDSRMRAYPEELTPASEEQEKHLPKVAQNPFVPGKKPVLKKNLEKKAIDKESSGAYSDVSDAYSGLSKEEKSVVDTLKNGARLVDDVIAETGLTTGKMLACLTMMELKGILRRLPGKRVELKMESKRSY